MDINSMSFTEFVVVIALAFSPLLWAEVELPLVPASVMKSSASPEPEAASASRETSPSSLQLVMTPGVNELIPIAVGHLNRIVTPFDRPRIRTTSDARTQIKGQVVYVATDKEAPVSLYITPPEQEQPALSLTLIPRRIPPREVTLRLPADAGLMPGVVNRRAAQWETAQPYVDGLRDLFRSLALNKLPQGYAIRKAKASDVVPKCFQPGLQFDFRAGQVIAGHYFTVYVGLVNSFADQPIELHEQSCAAENLVAGAFWPRHILAPDERAEVLIVVRNHREEPVESQRPSLLPEGGQ